MGPLRVIIINEVDGARRNIKNMLTRHDFFIAAEVKDAVSGIKAMASSTAELIITEDATAGWQEVARYARERHLAPVLLIVSQEGEDAAAEAARLGVAGLIVRPLTERNLSILARFTAMAHAATASHRPETLRFIRGLRYARKGPFDAVR